MLHHVESNGGDGRLIAEIAEAIGARTVRARTRCPDGIALNQFCWSCENTAFSDATFHYTIRAKGPVAVEGLIENWLWTLYIPGRYARRLYRWLQTPEAEVLLKDTWLPPWQLSTLLEERGLVPETMNDEGEEEEDEDTSPTTEHEPTSRAMDIAEADEALRRQELEQTRVPRFLIECERLGSLANAKEHELLAVAAEFQPDLALLNQALEHTERAALGIVKLACFRRHLLRRPKERPVIGWVDAMARGAWVRQRNAFESSMSPNDAEQILERAARMGSDLLRTEVARQRESLGPTPETPN